MIIVCISNYRPHENGDDSDSDDSVASGRLVIDISSEDSVSPAPVYSPISSVGEKAAAELPTGDGVYSPFSPVSAGTSYTPRSMSLSPVACDKAAMYTIDEEFQRLAEMDIDDLEKEIEELCGDGQGEQTSPCISLAAPSEPGSWLASPVEPAVQSDVVASAPAVTDAAPTMPDVRPRDPVASTLNRRVRVSARGDRRIVVRRSPAQREDPRQDEYLMTLLDARGQMPSRKSEYSLSYVMIEIARCPASQIYKHANVLVIISRRGVGLYMKL